MDVDHLTLGGWGGFRPATATRHMPRDAGELGAGPLPPRDVIARGLGRSYGDAAQHDGGHVVVTTECRHVEWVDRAAGVVRVDAGVTIGDLTDRFAPKGWFVPVSPGTRQVTVGGAIAADIHGKNHHIDGTFGIHVESMRLRLADDDVVDTSTSDAPDLFWATVGGMGLTGVIVDADVRLTAIASTTLLVETRRLRTLGELLAEMAQSDADHTFSVAWVDLLGGGRSVLTQGSFARPDDIEPASHGAHEAPTSRSIGLPPLPPTRLVRSPLMRVFNEAWWRRAPAEPATTRASITSFFHPLDAVAGWNRLYGPAGFLQWQCVVPERRLDTLHDICVQLGRLPSFLTVLKRFGDANRAPLSFPLAGWTLAVDLPVTTDVLTGLTALDRQVAAAGGRIYLAKDARLAPDLFEEMYPRLDEWKRVRAAVDPAGRFSSDLSVRLGL